MVRNKREQIKKYFGQGLGVLFFFCGVRDSGLQEQHCLGDRRPGPAYLSLWNTRLRKTFSLWVSVSTDDFQEPVFSLGGQSPWVLSAPITWKGLFLPRKVLLGWGGLSQDPQTAASPPLRCCSPPAISHPC